MRDPARIESMLDLIREIWIAQPDFRLGQILAGSLQNAGHDPDIFYVEDDELRACLGEYQRLIATKKV